MEFNARIYVTLKPTVNDPQGNAVLNNLRALGFADVYEVRVGKFLALRVSATDERTAQEKVNAMCDKLLANPVIESYTMELAAAG